MEVINVENADDTCVRRLIQTPSTIHDMHHHV